MNLPISESKIIESAKICRLTQYFTLYFSTNKDLTELRNIIYYLQNFVITNAADIPNYKDILNVFNNFNNIMNPHMSDRIHSLVQGFNLFELKQSPVILDALLLFFDTANIECKCGCKSVELKEINSTQNKILLEQQDLLEEMRKYVENLPENLDNLTSIVNRKICTAEYLARTNR